MRRAIIATTAALGLALGMAGPAGASIILDNWTFDFTGLDGLGSTVVSNINQVTFTGVAHAQSVDGVLAPGGMFITDGHLSSTSFVDPGGVIIPSFLNAPTGGPSPSYELTFAFSVDGRYTEITPTVATFEHLAATNADGLLEMWVDNLNGGLGTQASSGTGDGFMDGVKIATFQIVTGGGGSYNFANSDGGDDATFELVSALPDVFLDAPGGNDLAEFGNLLIAITDSNFDGAPGNVTPFNRAAPTNWGSYYPGRTGTGSPLAFFANEDGSAGLGVVPEPGTMVLLGSGLLGLAGYSRKRSKKV